MTDEPASRSGLQTIDRATLVLRAFSPARPWLGVTELASIIGLSTSTTFRLVAAMQQNGLLRQSDDRKYGLGPLLVRIAHHALTDDRLREAARPVMEKLRDQVEETVGLHELVGSTHRITVAQAESRQALRRTYTDLGTPIPLPQGAPGKVLLAFLPASLQEAVLSVPLDQVTKSTITKPDKLRSELGKIRQNRYAVSLGERTIGIRSVAAAIWAGEGAPVACLSISAPEMRMDNSRCQVLGEVVREAADQVSSDLGVEPGTIEAAVRIAAPSM